MTKSESMSLRLPLETKQKLEQLAKATGRNKTSLAIEALDEYINQQSWQIQMIQEGIAVADDGQLVSMEEVEAKWMNK
jgi:RHH-type transcriptional regulator, rel operon repressor / antitoxin RelB